MFWIEKKLLYCFWFHMLLRLDLFHLLHYILTNRFTDYHNYLKCALLHMIVVELNRDFPFWQWIYNSEVDVIYVGGYNIVCNKPYSIQIGFRPISVDCINLNWYDSSLTCKFWIWWIKHQKFEYIKYTCIDKSCISTRGDYPN